jgi:hypothetical protein
VSRFIDIFRRKRDFRSIGGAGRQGSVNEVANLREIVRCDLNCVIRLERAAFRVPTLIVVLPSGTNCKARSGNFLAFQPSALKSCQYAFRMRALSSPAVAADGADVIMPMENDAFVGGTKTSALPLTMICGRGVAGACWAFALWLRTTQVMVVTVAKILVVLLNVLMPAPVSRIVDRGSVPYAANVRLLASK